MSTTTINTPHPAPDFRISIFNHPLYRSTTQGWEPFVAAGLYIKQSLSWNDSRVVVLKCQMVKVELEMLTLSSVHNTEMVLGLYYSWILGEEEEEETHGF